MHRSSRSNRELSIEDEFRLNFMKAPFSGDDNRIETEIFIEKIDKKVEKAIKSQKMTASAFTIDHCLEKGSSL